MICEFEPDGDHLKCKHCNQPSLPAGKKYYRQCISKQTTGLGDIIARTTKRLKIKQCEGCKKRQERLNKIMPDINDISKAVTELFGLSIVAVLALAAMLLICSIRIDQ